MEVKAIKMENLFDKENDIYTNVIITAKRSRQIIDSRALDFEEIENIEDSLLYKPVKGLAPMIFPSIIKSGEEEFENTPIIDPAEPSKETDV